jgi:hypothetical protein
VEQLTEAVKKLADLSRSLGPEQLLTASDANRDVTNTRATILATVAGIKMLVGGPTDFLQNLASQVCNLYMYLTASFPRLGSSPDPRPAPCPPRTLPPAARLN